MELVVDQGLRNDMRQGAGGAPHGVSCQLVVGGSQSSSVSSTSVLAPNGWSWMNCAVSAYIFRIAVSAAVASMRHCPRPPTLIAGMVPERTRA